MSALEAVKHIGEQAAVSAITSVSEAIKEEAIDAAMHLAGEDDIKISDDDKHSAKIPGLKKKAVALYLLRQLMKDVVADIPLQSYLLSTAQTIGEHLLETLADVSRNLNMAEVATTCCLSLLSR